MRRILVSLAVFALVPAPFLQSQSAPAKTPSTPTEAAPRQTCGFEFGTICGTQAVANTDASQRNPVTIIDLNRGRNGCPVGFYAGHSSSLTLLPARDAKSGVISQSLNFRMDNSTPHDIVSAQITLHGLSTHPRVLPANTAATGDLSKQVALHLPVNAGKQAATDLRVYGFTSVQRIDLDSLTYADGTTWTASPQQICSIIPNGMMLVAAAAQ